MSEENLITRIASRGDGVTHSGEHVPGGVPGDRLMADGSLEFGPHRAEPVCRHFGTCGGCQLQQADDEVLAAFVADRVINAIDGQGLTVDRIAPTHLSSPNSRRRASLRAINGGGRPLIGFRESGSHKLVDLKECHILAPELWNLVGPLRSLLSRRSGKYGLDLELVSVDEGVDVMIKGLTLDGLAETEAMLDFARDNGLARLTVDQGYGAETLWEPEPVHVTFSGVPVPYPTGSFLQATRDGEDALISAAAGWLHGARFVADLFSGLGPFAFALAKQGAKVLAAEAAQSAYLACKAASGTSGAQVHALHRDLFRNPLQLDELNRFDGIVLDPPRAGAREQCSLLAQSSVRSVAYVSCNPASWARDARQLVDGGYRLVEVRPVGQFRWSTHVELASLFLRED